MANRKQNLSILEAVAPVKALFIRLSLFFMAFAAIGIIAIGRMDNDMAKKFRAKVVDIATPALTVLSSPVHAYNSIKQGIYQSTFVYQENIALREENARLKTVKSVALELEAENQRLRKLLNYIPSGGVSFSTARVVGNTGGPYKRFLIIDSGAEAGLISGQIVTNEKGLVGRVGEVGDSSARIIMITDLASRVPVITDQSRERAVLAGNNNSLPSLLHLPEKSNVTVGEKILTSGDGKFFPAGMPVGVIEKVSKRGITVKPFVDWGRLEYVTITNRNKK